MTDKELRKLSRLELLELLLEASNENKRLNEKIKVLTEESKAARNIENLSSATLQVESALKYASSLIDNLKASAQKVPENTGGKKNHTASERKTDREIYVRMLSFFAENDDKLSVFPEDTAHIVRTRINDIFERRKSN